MFGCGVLALGYAFPHAGNAAAIRLDQFEIVHDGFQYISVHDLENCILEFHWNALFVFDVTAP